MPTTWTRTVALTAATALLGAGSVWGAGAASAETVVPQPDGFTSAYTVNAGPDTIIDSTGAPVQGQPGASGTFDIAINSEQDVICWDMDVRGLEGAIEGPTKTGVAIREAPVNFGGPARISVPDPEREGDRRTGGGCAQGPFTTGTDGDDGRDTGTFFSLADLEADPASYAVDIRTDAFPEGAIRGQLSPVPVGGLDTGLGGAAGPTTLRVTMGAAAVAAVLAAGLVVVRRTRLPD